MDLPTPQEAYQHLGFALFECQGEFVDAILWRRVQETNVLEEIRQRYLIRRHCVGQPIVHEGYVIGTVPAHSLTPEEVEKVLCGLTEGITRGCRTVSEWQALRRQSSIN